MDVTGKTTLFLENVKGKEGSYRRYSISLSTKNEDGSYTHMSLKAIFTKNEERDSKLMKLDASKCYEMEIKEGWLKVESFVNKEGNTQKAIRVVIKEATLTAEKDFVKHDVRVNSSNNKLPF